MADQRQRGGGDHQRHVPYTCREYAAMVFILGECHGNAREAARVYAQRYENLRHPNHQTILSAMNRLEEDGNVIPRAHRGPGHGMAGRPDRDRNGSDEERVLACVRDNPQTSIRKMESELELPYHFIQRALKQNNQHAYHYTKVHELRPADYAARSLFCREMLRRIDQDPEFLLNVLFTDESTFGRDDTFNTHNHHHYAEENPHVTVQTKHQTRLSTNKWVRIVGNNIIGPINFPIPLTSVFYSNFLRNRLRILIQNIPDARFGNIIYQHDGAPQHTADITLDVLDNLFPGRWIGQGRGDRQPVIRWPPRSPDLNPLDFFYWGWIKEKIYCNEIVNIDDLEFRITAAAASITPEMLEDVRRNFVKRLRLCLRRAGGHIEQYL
uniref:DUF4817 domain-containing protein n=1 Tax=Trichogramma kaykai TaxID=54128 RepID=A0ABD2X775_9HYME